MNTNLIKAAATALVLLIAASVIYALEHEPQGPLHTHKSNTTTLR